MFVTKDIKLSCMIQLFCPKYRVCFLFHSCNFTRWELREDSMVLFCLMPIDWFDQQWKSNSLVTDDVWYVWLMKGSSSLSMYCKFKTVYFVSRVWGELSKSWRKQKNKWLGNYQLFWIVEKCLRLWWKNKLGLILATVNSSTTRRKSGFTTELIDSLKFKPVLFIPWHGSWDMVAKWKESEIAQC